MKKKITNSLFFKLLFPFAGILLVLVFTSSILFEHGSERTTREIMAAQISSDLEGLIRSMISRTQAVQSGSGVLAQNPDIISALKTGASSEEDLSIINSRSILVRDRFGLDLIQIYDSNDQARTNIVQSALFRVSYLLPHTGSDFLDTLLLDDGTILYLSAQSIGEGEGTIITGLDLNEELQRLLIQQNLSGEVFLELGSPDEINQSKYYWEGKETFVGEFVLEIGSLPIRFLLRRDTQEMNQVIDAGRNVMIWNSVILSVLVLCFSSFVILLITRPIHQVANASKELSAGNFESAIQKLNSFDNGLNPFHIGRNDELSILVNEFSSMARKLEDIYRGLINDLQKSYKELDHAYTATLRGWSSALELRDYETERHTKRVVKISLDLAGILNVPEEEHIHIRRGALLHDIGKLAIPDHILRKPGPLSHEEWMVMRQHPLYGYVMLRSIDYLKKATVIPYSHHERWDGSGYPRGLKGEEIPLYARIFMVADVYDALLEDRPYRKGWNKEDSIAFILSNSGKLFDPRVVRAFQIWAISSSTKP